MKKILRTALLLAAFLPFACTEKPIVEPDPNENQEPTVEPVTLTLTFVAPDKGSKTAWVAGDQSVVHGEFAAQQVVVTLDAGDIKDGGKTASKEVGNLYPYVREDCASTLYASWPASLADNLKHCFFYSKFSTTTEELLAACNDAGNNFRFQPVGGTLSFSTGSEVFDSFTIIANKKESLGYSFMQVKLTDQEQNFKQYVGDPLLELDLPSGKAKNTVYLPEGTKIAGGVLIKFRKGGEFVKSYRTTEPISIERGKNTDLGDISSEIKTYVNPFSSDVKDLDTEGNANCYIVTAPGSYKFKAVQGITSNAFFEDPSDAVVLWETWNDASEVENGSVVESASYAEDYMILKMPATLHPGNAVVALRDSEGTIIWSWHIWVPATAITTDEYGGIMGSAVMDRNLGALVAAKAEKTLVDPLSYGLFYQWGRKDPFTASPVAKKDAVATWAGADDEVAPGQISVAESIANPRLLGHLNNGDWAYDSDLTLWTDDGKTIYDPCPPGYRVPPRNSAPFWSSSITSQTGWAIDSENGWITLGNPVAVFPIAGYRDDYDVGGVCKVGARALYWNARASDELKAYGADLRYDKGTYSGAGSAPRARLASVRCVAE